MKQGLGIALFWILFTVSLTAQCPTVEVIGPQAITAPGDNIVFRAEVGVVGPKLEYSWQLDKGIIVDGQGTSKITVSTFALGRETVTATVQIGGLPNSCSSSASGSAGIMPFQSGWHWEDSFAKVKPNEIRGRLDSFFIDLIRWNPDQMGFIQLQVTSKEKFDSSNIRIKFILNHAKFRELDKRRLWFALELAEEARTNLMRFMLKDASEIPCDKCLIIRGEHL